MTRTWGIGLLLALLLVAVPSAMSADTLAVRLVSQTDTTITLGWTPQSGFGYLFSADGRLVARTNDPARSTVRFAKGSTTYEVAVIVKGATGTYPPPVAADTTAPSAPPNLHVESKTQTQVVLHWDDATDNVGVVNYRIYRGSSLIGQGPGTAAGQQNMWTDNGRVCGTTYQYAVEAQDAAGNTGPKSTLTAATEACPPPPPPTGGTMTSAQFSAAAVAGATISNVTVTGDASISAANVTVSNATIQGDVTFNPGATGSSLRGSSATALYIWGADNITVDGNTFDGHNQTLGGKMWDEPAGNPPKNITITRNVFKNQNTGNINDHSQAMFVGYSDGVLFDGNTFTNNGTTSHIFFSWFGNLANPATSYPRNVCVRNNIFNQTAGAYFDINFRAEIPVSANIKIQANASNTDPEFYGAC